MQRSYSIKITICISRSDKGKTRKDRKKKGKKEITRKKQEKEIRTNKR
jgi:hypothetical protein